MKANTRLFGEIDIEDDKIITMDGGMIGFPFLQKFTLIFDEEKEKKAGYILFHRNLPPLNVSICFLFLF